MKNHRPLIFALCLCLSIFLCSCLSEVPKEDNTPLADTSKEERGQILFEGRRFSYTGETDCVSADRDILTISRSGTYRLSGELTEGRLRIDCLDGGGVRLILDGVSLCSSIGEVIRGENGNLTIETAKDTVNTLRGGDKQGFACISSRTDIILCGSGRLIVHSDAPKAIHSMTHVRMVSGSVTVSAPQVGVGARDRIIMDGGRLTVSYGRIGLCADSYEGSLGEILINGGTLTAKCEEIALSSGRLICVSGGEGSLDAPVFYKCLSLKDGKEIMGRIEINSENFPNK